MNFMKPFTLTEKEGFCMFKKLLAPPGKKPRLSDAEVARKYPRYRIFWNDRNKPTILSLPTGFIE